MKSSVLGACLCSAYLAFGAPAVAAEQAPAGDGEAFKPETVTMKKTVDEGPYVLVNQASWDGASRVHVLQQDGLGYQGVLSGGLTSQFVIGNDHETAYTLSDYMERYTYGPIHSVVQIWDLSTLTPTAEIEVPNKAVKAIGMNQLIEVSADDKRLYVQNATPGTSVTVIDLDGRKVLTEVPTPGCYGIIPAASGHAFSTFCGAGTLQKFAPDAGGEQYTSTASEKIFDATDDPLYVDSVRRADGELVLASFNGNLYLVDDSGDAPVLDKKLAVTDGVDGDWAPGGYSVLAYNAAHDMVFMIVHSDAYEGSHKDGSEQIWAYSLADEKLVSRSDAPSLVAIAASQGDAPKLFGSNEDEESVDEYTLADADNFEYERSGRDKHVGWTTSLLTTP